MFELVYHIIIITFFILLAILLLIWSRELKKPTEAKVLTAGYTLAGLNEPCIVNTNINTDVQNFPSEYTLQPCQTGLKCVTGIYQGSLDDNNSGVCKAEIGQSCYTNSDCISDSDNFGNAVSCVNNICEIKDTILNQRCGNDNFDSCNGDVRYACVSNKCKVKPDIYLTPSGVTPSGIPSKTSSGMTPSGCGIDEDCASSNQYNKSYCSVSTKTCKVYTPLGGFVSSGNPSDCISGSITTLNSQKYCLIAPDTIKLNGILGKPCIIGSNKIFNDIFITFDDTDISDNIINIPKHGLYDGVSLILSEGNININGTQLSSDDTLKVNVIDDNNFYFSEPNDSTNAILRLSLDDSVSEVTFKFDSSQIKCLFSEDIYLNNLYSDIPEVSSHAGDTEADNCVEEYLCMRDVDTGTKLCRPQIDPFHIYAGRCLIGSSPYNVKEFKINQDSKLTYIQYINGTLTTTVLLENNDYLSNGDDVIYNNNRYYIQFESDKGGLFNLYYDKNLSTPFKGELKQGEILISSYVPNNHCVANAGGPVLKDLNTGVTTENLCVTGNIGTDIYITKYDFTQGWEKLLTTSLNINNVFKVVKKDDIFYVVYKDSSNNFKYKKISNNVITDNDLNTSSLYDIDFIDDEPCFISVSSPLIKLHYKIFPSAGETILTDLDAIKYTNIQIKCFDVNTTYFFFSYCISTVDYSYFYIYLLNKSDAIDTFEYKFIIKKSNVNDFEIKDINLGTTINTSGEKNIFITLRVYFENPLSYDEYYLYNIGNNPPKFDNDISDRSEYISTFYKTINNKSFNTEQYKQSISREIKLSTININSVYSLYHEYHPYKDGTLYIFGNFSDITPFSQGESYNAIYKVNEDEIEGIPVNYILSGDVKIGDIGKSFSIPYKYGRITADDLGIYFVTETCV